MLVVAEELQE
jgi:hypothetical protein